MSYTRNALNQYSGITNPLTFDVNGTATNSATNTNGITVAIGTGTPYAPDAIQPGTNGVTARWRKQMTATSADNSKATWETVNIKENTNPKDNGTVKLQPVNQSPTYDDDGNLTADGTWIYKWDAENRLIAMKQTILPQGTGAPTALAKVEFSYDGLSRRIGKRTYSWSTSVWTLITSEAYTYDGWNVVLRANTFGATPAWKQAYVWGPDLSGSAQGAGGVGGLLIEYEYNAGAPHRRLVGYDGNGNVTTLGNGSNGELWALYEYDAFGNQIRHVSTISTHANDNPFRFSTKMTDDETGLVYYGYRYYSPGLGRWIIRDPIEEYGFETVTQQFKSFLKGSTGINLFLSNANDSINFIDKLGLIETIAMKGRGLDSLTIAPVRGESAGYRHPCDNPYSQVCRDPCSWAVLNGLAPTSAGGVVCCCGQKYICLWHRPIRHQGCNSRLANAMVDRCIREHERTHLGDIDCPPKDPNVTRPPPRNGWADIDPEEAAAYVVERACLRKARKECRRDPECLRCVDRKLQFVQDQINHHAPGAGW